MLNRRLIRVKVFQALYAYVQDDQPSLNKSKTYLKESVAGIHQNFLTVLLFPIELIHFIRITKDPKLNKYLPNDEGIKQYEALSMNGLYEYLVQQESLKKTIERPPHNWQRDSGLLGSMYRQLLEDPKTEKYLKADYTDFKVQLKFFISIFDFLKESEEFDQAMEEVEMLWEDEKIPVYKAIRSVLSELKKEQSLVLPVMDEKDSDGQLYANELLTQSTRGLQEFGDLIAKNAPGWDKDRIAKADMMLMTMALTELIHFPYIPIKVTLNEYLELAKNYSTPQSSKFVNGVLDKLIGQLKADNRIIKKGRGMIE